jgi:methylmalonyl-CoA/ethylmalonyl-CoA epimerase
VTKLNHIGIIVSDLEAAILKYQEVLGVKLDRIEDYGAGLLRIAFFPLGEILLELIQPLRPGSTAWDFLQEHGEGIEHLAFQVDDIAAECSRLIRENIPVADWAPRAGAGKTQICFLKREALCGVLGEFVAEGDCSETGSV